MTSSKTRRLLAVMFTDVVGYTALMQRDEEAARIVRRRHRNVLDGAVSEHHGDLLQYFGDGSLSTFPSVVDAVRAAIEVQRELRQEPAVPLRIGIHEGDISYDTQGAFGDSVNVASRIESLGVAGSILISAKVHDEIKNQPTISTIRLGAFELKNVEESLEVYAVVSDAVTVPTRGDVLAAIRSEPATKSDAIIRLNTALAGRYRIERELAEGGMATVYMAHDLKHQRGVALKVLKPELAAAVGAERFLAEIETTAHLMHPHVLPLFDSGEAGGFLFYVMPYVDGETLQDRIAREKQLPVDEAVRIAIGVASALDHAHRHNVIHRDIKPGNILLQDGEPIVADFGIALAVGTAGGDRRTESGLSLGTPQYMSPEQAAGERDLDARSDIYSLACVLYEMLAGEPPHTGSTQAVIVKHLTVEPASLRLRRDEVSEELDNLVRKGLSKERASRFPSAEAFGRGLREGTRVSYAGKPLRPTRSLVVAASIAAVLGVGAFFANRSASTEALQPRRDRQLTFDGFVRETALAPGGNFLAYVSNADTWWRLYVREVAGNNPILLDSVQTLLCCVAWSPDGREIAYQRGARSTGSTVVTPRLGGRRRQLDAEVALSWSMDGTRLLSWWPAARYLSLTDTESGTRVDSIPLGDEHSWVNAAHWSPRGDRVVVALENPQGFSTIRTLELNGSVVEDLVFSSTRLTSPRWGRDGAAIYYRSPDEIWKIPVTADGHSRGDALRLLSDVQNGVFNDVAPAIHLSDDGERLLYTRSVGHSNLWVIESYVSGEEGPGEPRQLTRGTADRLTPRLSPNGRLVAFVESVEGVTNLYVVPPDGGGARQLTFFEGGVWSPAWSPDGTRIAFGSAEGGEAGLWLVELDGGTLRRGSLDTFEGEHITWAPGENILYQSRDHLELRSIDPETWTERVVASRQSRTWWYAHRVSPNGETIAVLRTGGPREGLWLLDLVGGSPQFVFDAMEPIGWSTDGQFIFAMNTLPPEGTEREIYRIRTTDGERELHMTLPPGQGANPREVTISEDGRTVVASVSVRSTDAWLVEGFDPR